MHHILDIREVNDVLSIAKDSDKRMIAVNNLHNATYPIINFIFPALAASTIVGMHCGSLGPNIP